MPIHFTCTCRFTRKNEFSQATLIADTECGYHACARRDAAKNAAPQVPLSVRPGSADPRSSFTTPAGAALDTRLPEVAEFDYSAAALLREVRDRWYRHETYSQLKVDIDEYLERADAALVSPLAAKDTK